MTPAPRPPQWRKKLRRFYVRRIRPRLATPLAQQRARLAFYGWSYLRLLGPSALRPRQRLGLVRSCLRVDWSLEHAHRPPEVVAVLRAVAERAARPGEVVVEAGCWQGGATAKLSRACADPGKGTQEVLDGVRDRLTDDARVFTQDLHVPEVRAAIAELGLTARPVAYQLAEVAR